jgi:hypothetical protein
MYPGIPYLSGPLEHQKKAGRNMINRSSFLRFVALTGLTLGISGQISAQFLTIARKIKSMKSDGKDVSTVILDAGAAKVYTALIDTLESQPKFRITAKDDIKKHVEFEGGGSSLSMQVDSLDVRLSQITVLAVASGDAPPASTDAAASAILGVCRKVGLYCTQK